MAELLAVAQTYAGATVAIEKVGDYAVKAKDRLYFQCPTCHHIKWVHTDASLVRGAPCLECQRNVIHKAADVVAHPLKHAHINLHH